MADFNTAPDYFDSRDVIERIAELEGIAAIERLREWEQEELDALYELQEEAEGNVSDWQYGETFIHDNYFTEYAEELASDIGAIDPSAASWPLMHIDWEEAARDLQQDYTAFTFRGETYWARA